MLIKRHKGYFGEYDVYCNGILVAEIRRQLIGMDYSYVYFLPDLYKENDCTPIFKRYLSEKEVLEKAIKIIKKKLYKLSAGILEDIRLPDTKEE